MDDEHYMRQALKEARKAFEEDEIPIGAVIVQGDRIIARGYNQTERLTDTTAHAEILALTSAFNFLGSKYLPEATLYVTIEPCLMCAGALYWSKIARVVYGAGDEKNGYRRGLTAIHLEPSDPPNQPISPLLPGIPPGWPFHPKTELITGILSDECAALMREFFRNKRKNSL